MTTCVGLRDRTRVTVLAVQGWRISEALGLRVEDLAEEQGQKGGTCQ
jgi:integrase